MNETYLIINENIDIFIEQVILSNQELYFIISNKTTKIHSEFIKSFFYRRGIAILGTKKRFPIIIERFLKREEDTIISFVIRQLEKKNHIGNYFIIQPNKLCQLEKAINIGLDIPQTVISSNKEVLIKYLAQDEWITKAIQENEFTTIKSLNSSFIIHQAKEFFPSLIQEKLEKLYELRIFFMNDDYYAMAIFSQLDEQTSLDFRNYNKQKPNRTVPYKLPKDILQKLKKLMQELGLNTGSIDMVVTKDKRYVFLEVNPVGQFGMVSYPCNYYLEKRVADYLST
jgi:ATP-GRASP peptide maturase of grasp-with-spasm system